MQRDADREAALRELLGGARELRERLLAEPLRQLDVAAHRGGHRDAQRTCVREVLARLAVEDVQVGPRRHRRLLAEIEDMDLLVARRVEERETTAADPRALRL